MIKNLKIRTKLLLTFSLIIVVSIIAIVINFIHLSSLSQKSVHIINIVDPAENAVFDLRNSFNVDIRAIEKYANGFADLEETEKIVHSSEAKIESDIKKIESSDLVHPEHVQSLRNILEKDEVYDEKVFDLKKSAINNSDQLIMSPDLRQALISFDLINAEVKKTIEVIIDDFKQHKKEDESEFENSINHNKLLIAGVFIASIITALLVALITALTLSASIRKVRDAALKMSKGDLSQRVPVKSRDEIGELSSAFNQMADNISKSQEDLKKNDEQLRLEKANLDQKVEELERFNRLTVGRELKMIELKKEIKALQELKNKRANSS